MNIYLIIHEYEVDGGYGDGILTQETLFATTDKALAEAYCRKWNDPFVYDKPYDSLEKNSLFVEEINNNDFDLNTPPPEWSFYEIRKEKFPVEYEARQKEIELRRRAAKIEKEKKQREKELDELKAACEAVGCTFTPAD